MTVTSHKTERVDLRLEPEVKQVWERGAQLAGVSLAAFIKMVTTERATDLINAYDTLTLSPAESAWFVELLQQPADAPTPAMQRASARRRELLGE